MTRKLSRLMNGYPLINLIGSLDREITSIAYDSRKIEEGALFIAIPGHHHDGSRFIVEACQKRAAAFITEAPAEQVLEMGLGSTQASALLVNDSRHALAWVASQFYAHPSNELSLVGITGTNGKTTLTYLLESIFRAAGRDSGVIGSISYRYGGNVRPAPMTTPEALEINGMLREMVDAGIHHCFMEVSSHSLALKRVRELKFEVGVFTNLTRDHLDYHETFEHYKESKKRLFRDCTVNKRVINMDDPVGQEILDEHSIEVLTTGLDPIANVTAEGCILSKDGIRFTLKSPFGDQAILSPLLGQHNVYNILSASAVALLQGLSLEHIAEGVQNLKSVPGRFEKVECGQDFIVAVDYAHTDDALLNALRAAREIATNRVIVVFGCGGDRDPGKRPVMGRVALEYSELAVITSDNPRTENPDRIIQDICEGLPEGVVEGADYLVESDRRQAIAEAIKFAQPGDLVLIAGKGHEDYQILGTRKIHFDDREEAVAALNQRLAS